MGSAFLIERFANHARCPDLVPPEARIHRSGIFCGFLQRFPIFGRRRTVDLPEGAGEVVGIGKTASLRNLRHAQGGAAEKLERTAYAGEIDVIRDGHAYLFVKAGGEIVLVD